MSNASEKRKRLVLRAIVHEYLETAEPVGSGTLVEKYDFKVSAATIRNDMVELEELGLLVQPHTSAGRIPTEAGYKFYVEQFVHDQELVQHRRQDVETAVADVDAEKDRPMRELAKTLAQITGETVVVSSEDGGTYITGVSNLVQKPEFREAALMLSISQMIDDLEHVFNELENRMMKDVQVLIGADNPFGERMSSVVTRYALPQYGEGVIGLLGPTRMDYDENIALMRYIHEYFS